MWACFPAYFLEGETTVKWGWIKLLPFIDPKLEQDFDVHRLNADGFVLAFLVEGQIQGMQFCIHMQN